MQQQMEPKPYGDPEDNDKSYYPIKMLVAPLLCNGTAEGFGMYNAQLNPAAKCVFTGLFILFAVMIAWDCNKYEPLMNRAIYTFFAGIFSFWYILYYLIYRIFMGNKCY